MDKLHFHYRNQPFTANLQEGIDLSIPLRHGHDNPNCYYTPNPVFNPITSGEFVGSVEEGGACNHYQLTISPHGNGTHTECYGHISADSNATIYDCLKRFHFLARVITLRPQVLADGDRVILHKMLSQALSGPLSEALVIRTEPNGPEKLNCKYSGSNPPYLDAEAAGFLADQGVLHLLVDLPSVDKEQDAGQLRAHKAFWKFPEKTRKECTITELIYVPPNIEDGDYLLNLQISSIMADASPSKPLLYPLK